MGRKNPDRYTDADWRNAGSTVEALITNGWPVHTQCQVCDLRMEADLRRIAIAKGRRFSLWGAEPRCRRMGCPGRVLFYVRPHGAFSAICMTAPPRR